MKRGYRHYCRTATVMFASITIYSVAVKLFQDRLGEDWLHSALHVCSGAYGAYAGWYAANMTSAKIFTSGIGLLYFVLGWYGWFTPGLFLTTPFVIPLGPADNIFHLLLSVPALVIIALDLRASRRAGKG